jgi:predicted house-cleaning noncanonical NTP pyrophosphatase (MazG superfamily)
MTIYNKLVRDKIPEIIEKSGEIPHTRILDGEEYALLLEKKLDEEVGEYHQDKNAEELADILEVVFALAENIGCSRQELMEIYQRKHDARGGFADRCFLIGKEKA